MRKKLASVWIVPLALAAIILGETIVWIVFSPSASLVVAIVATQVATGALVLWLSQRQRRHSFQIEQTVERHAGQIKRAIGKSLRRIEENYQQFENLEAQIRDGNNEVQEVLKLNTSELRRLSQMPTNLRPHPIESRLLDELAEVQDSLKVLHNQLNSLNASREETTEQVPKTP